MKKFYITKELLETKSLSELDFELYDLFGYKPELDEEFHQIDVDSGHDRRFYVDATPISIDLLEKTILEFKKKKATHIQMTHDGDHHGYEFTAVLINKADQKYIDLYENERAKKRKLTDQYNEKIKELREIENKIQHLKI